LVRLETETETTTLVTSDLRHQERYIGGKFSKIMVMASLY